MTLKDCIYVIKSDRKAWLSLFAVIAIGTGALVFGRCSGGTLTGNDEYDSIQAAHERELRDEQEERNGNARNRDHDGNAGNRDYDGNAGNKYYAVEEHKVTLQPFDPNTADSTALLALGLQPWQVRSIYKYRAAGGVYTCREDFARLYGLSLKKYRELEPYIRIAPEYRQASETVRARRQHYDNYSSAGHPAYNTGAGNGSRSGNAAGVGNGTNAGNGSGTSNGAGSGNGADGNTTAQQGYVQKLKAGQTIPLNTSDTLELRKVPGIGAYFARRIAKYREQLGGFVSKEQLLEIQDFPESALPYFSLSASDAVRKIKINTATSEQLRKHPYISYLMARQILDYRRLRGNISNLDDLSLLPSFRPKVIEKLRPYIAY